MIGIHTSLLAVSLTERVCGCGDTPSPFLVCFVSFPGQKAAAARSIVLTGCSNMRPPAPPDPLDVLFPAETPVNAVITPAPVVVPVVPPVDPHYEPKPAMTDSWQPSSRPRRDYREATVPSGSISRAMQFGSLVCWHRTTGLCFGVGLIVCRDMLV